jgi:two-component system cell cycle response regulator
MITLIAEDDAVTRHLLESLLTKWGHTVCTADNGTTAMQLLERVSPPVIVMLDWMMPGVSGIEVCRTLRQRLSQKEAYVLMLTALHEKADILEALDAGADDYLSKPITPAKLRGRLQVADRLLTIEQDLIDARRNLAYEISHDALTGMPNRESILLTLKALLDRSRVENIPLAVAFVGLVPDDQAADLHSESATVAEAAERIGAITRRALGSVRSYDAVGRMGDTSFLVIYPGAGQATAMNQVTRLHTSLTRRTGVLHFAVHIGVVCTETMHDCTLDELVRAAEAAALKAARGSSAFEFAEGATTFPANETPEEGVNEIQVSS